jgi:predicted RNA binding protein YcfA (HicA-like mRNA interferase family)
MLMPKFPAVKSEKLVKVLFQLGFLKHHQVGSHAQFKHSDGRRITVPIHRGKEIPCGTLQAIVRDLGISREDFINLLRE